jgi:hypothetical protein
MEKWFARSTRFRDLYHGDLNREFDFEIEVKPAAWPSFARKRTYRGFCSLLTYHRMIWLSSAVFVCLQRHVVDSEVYRDIGGVLIYSFEPKEKRPDLYGPGIPVMCIWRLVGVVDEASVIGCDNLFKLCVSACATAEMEMYAPEASVECPFSQAGLTAAFTANLTSLQTLTFQEMTFNQHHVQALLTATNENLEIHLSKCRLTAEASASLAENSLRRNNIQGGSKLHIDNCIVDATELASAMQGPSSLTALTIKRDNPAPGIETLVHLRAFGGNESLLKMHIHPSLFASDEAWFSFVQQLEAHPKLRELDFSGDGGWPFSEEPGGRAETWTQSLADLLLVNRKLHTLNLGMFGSVNTRLTKVIRERLAVNVYQDRLVPIIKISNEGLRLKLLGRVASVMSRRCDLDHDDPVRIFVLLKHLLPLMSSSWTVERQVLRPLEDSFLRKHIYSFVYPAMEERARVAVVRRPTRDGASRNNRRGWFPMFDVWRDNQEGVMQGFANQAGVIQEFANQDFANQEFASQEFAIQGFANQEFANQEFANQDFANQEGEEE